MATLREFQVALQEKIEELHEKEELIYELGLELSMKETIIEQLRAELSRYRAMALSNRSRSIGSTLSKNSLSNSLTAPNSPLITYSGPRTFRHRVHSSPRMITTSSSLSLECKVAMETEPKGLPKPASSSEHLQDNKNRLTLRVPVNRTKSCK